MPFFSFAGSDFTELYVGVGASRARGFVYGGREECTMYYLFIDEIDAIRRSRIPSNGGGNEEREQTLNQLLSEMDGFSVRRGIIVLVANEQTGDTG